jgi:PHD/YefM family antitoxin component YafN of YafNO toxin-antitoxin module
MRTPSNFRMLQDFGSLGCKEQTMQLDFVHGIDSLTNFKRDTSSILEKLKASGQPLVLTINGKAEVAVQDAASYQELLALAERAEMLEYLQKSKADIDARRTVPARKALENIAKKHKLKPAKR